MNSIFIYPGLSGYGSLAADNIWAGLNTFTQEIVGDISGNAATATILANARTIAGVSFDGSVNIAIPSTGLSDSANLARLDAANTFALANIFSTAVIIGAATTAGIKLRVQFGTLNVEEGDGSAAASIAVNLLNASSVQSGTLVASTSLAASKVGGILFSVPSIAGNGTLNADSTDVQGKVTSTITGVGTITLTFGTAYVVAPSGHANNETTANLTRANSTTTTLTITGTFVTGDVISYSVIGI